MAFVSSPGVVQVAFRYQWRSQQVENVVHAFVDTTIDGAKLEEIANAAVGWAQSSLMPLTSSDVTLTEVLVRDMSAQEGAQFLFTIAGGQPGGFVADAMPNNVSIAIRGSTSVGGRSGRGRWYFVGIPNTRVINGNEVRSDYLAQIVAALNDLKDVLEAVGAILGVLSTFHNKAPRAQGVLFAYTSFGAVDNTIDSQRRRLPGRGA